MKKFFTKILKAGVAFVATSLLAVTGHAQVVGSINTNNFALVTTNYNVQVPTNATATIAVPCCGTQEWDIVIQNMGTNRVHYTEDGTTPSPTVGLRLEPYNGFTQYDAYSNIVSRVEPASMRKITNRQGPLNLQSTNTLATLSNRVAVVQRLWVPLKRYP